MENEFNVREVCNELDSQVEKWGEFEKNFVLWELLKDYKDRLDIPEHLDTVEQCREYIVKHKLLVACNDLIEMLEWELWR